MPLSSVLFLMVAAACTVAAFAVVRSATISAGRASAGARPVRVLTAAHDLSPADVLDGSDLSALDVPGVAVPPGALTSPHGAIGSSPTSPIAAGEILTVTRLGPGGPVARMLPPGSVAYQVPVVTVPSGLRAGDHVDVLATPADDPAATIVAASDVRVLGLPASASASTFGAEGAAATWVLLLVSPPEAGVLASAGATSRLSLAVLPSGGFPGASSAGR
jgi:Flp pilus assembly protein CpaB